MPHEPKRRHSVARKGKRRSSINLAQSALIKCPNCGKMTLPHTVCKFCGYYKGNQVVKKKEKAKITRG